MKKLILLLTLINFACFSMEKSMEAEKQIPIFSNNSDKPLFLDKAAIEYSDFLKTFFTTRKEYAPEDIKINLTYEQLKNALNIINLFLDTNKDESKKITLTNALQQLSLQDLINAYFVADYFIIDEMKEYLSLLFNKPEFIEQLAQLDKEQLQSLEFIKTKDFLPGQAPKPLIKNVRDIDWSPDGSQYFVIYNNYNNSRQLFDNNGNAIGNPLNNIDYINWSPDGSRYFIRFRNSSGQLFDNNSNPVGNLLINIGPIYWSPNGARYFISFSDFSGLFFDNNANSIENLGMVDHIDWSPDGSRYYVTFIYSLGQLFDKDGNSIGNPLSNNIHYIYWSPDGSRYFLKSSNGSGQLFDNNGNSIENPLSNVIYINWSSDSSRYFIRFRNFSGRLFDNNANSIGTTLRNIDHINWSPDGSRYFIRFRNSSGQLFDNNGNCIGNPLSNISLNCTSSINWSPDSSRYFVRFGDFSGRLFDNNANSIGTTLRNVNYSDWSSDGSRYFIKFKNDSGRLFDKESNLILDLSAISGFFYRDPNTLILIDYLNKNLYMNKLKFLVKEVVDGYQIYRAKDRSPIGYPLQNKPLWIDTNTFKTNENDKEQYYSYQELSLPNLVECYITK